MEFENLPEGWGKDKLVNLTTKIGSGATPTGGSDVYLKNGEIALIRSQNIYNLSFSPNGLAYIEQNQANKLANVEVKKYDVLLNITGDSVARVCLVPDSYLPARVNQHVAILRADPEKLNARYLQYFLVAPTMQMHMLNLSSAGATRKALTKGMIEDFTIPIPPLPQQHKIASILGALDEKIELSNQMNQTLETMAKALFKSWFVDFEPFANGEFEESEFGMIPMGWRIGKFNDLCKILNGYAFKSQWWKDEGVKVVKIKNIDGTKVNIDDCQCVSDELAKQHTKFLLQDGDMLIAMTGATVGKVGIVNTEEQKLLLNQRVGKFIPIKIADSYIKTIIREDKFFDAIQNTAYGSAQPNISAGDIENMKIIIPNEQALEDFERSVSPMFRQVLENNKQTSILRRTRDSLLPKLMSGELNLNERLN